MQLVVMRVKYSTDPSVLVGSSLSRSQSDVATMLGPPPFGDHIDDKLVSFAGFCSD